MKFVSQAYFPLDKEIIREAWVAGDLKERLGVKHRRAERNADPEDASLFRPHVQGGSSDASDDREEYEPIALRSALRSPAHVGPTPLSQQTQESITPYASDLPSRHHDVDHAALSAPNSATGAPRAPSLGFQPVPLSARSLTPAMAE